MSDRVSSFGGSIQRGYQIDTMQSRLSLLTGEIASGQLANPAAAMGSNASILYQLQSQLSQQNELQTSITTASQNLDTAQTALTSIATAAQSANSSVLGYTVGDLSGLNAIGSQASSTIEQVLDLMNTNFLNQGVFAGDKNTAQPLQPLGASGGLKSIIQNTLSAAVTANGGPLTSSNISNLISGPNGIDSIFSDTNANPSMNYGGAIYTGASDGKPTSVIIGTNQTLQYDSSANQPAFRDLLKGLSMLSLLNSSAGQLDTSAQTTLLSQAGSVIAKAQNEITTLQGSLGSVQSSLTAATNAQQSAANATQAQIVNYVTVDAYSASTEITSLQTQIQASYELTSQISQLSLVHYMPAT